MSRDVRGDESDNENDSAGSDVNPVTTYSSNASNNSLTKKKTKSVIWNFFEYQGNSYMRRELALCQTCKKNVATHGGNISNLILIFKCIIQRSMRNFVALAPLLLLL